MLNRFFGKIKNGVFWLAGAFLESSDLLLDTLLWLISFMISLSNNE